MTGNTNTSELDAVLEGARSAQRWMAARTAEERRELLHGLARALENHADDLVAVAMSETHLAKPRLDGELARACGQFRVYGDAIASLQAPETSAPRPDATPPVPGLVRSKVPLGVVLVFAASNFPFAFGASGTDVASALAAGCAVVVKGHPGHPELSTRITEVLRRSLRAAGAPDGALALITGTEQGVEALLDERIAAGAFTGSTAGGEFLLGVANSRRTPVPFYCEMGSLNPVVIAPVAAAARTDELLAGFVDSFTSSAGQLCTKPGVLLWPADVPIPPSLTDRLRGVAPQTLLNQRISSAFAEVAAAVFDERRTERVFGEIPTQTSPAVTPILGIVDAATLREDAHSLLQECFGPAAVIVRYADEADVASVVEGLEGQLTGTIHADPADAEFVRAVLPTLAERVGRLVWGGWPTGVAVAWPQHHGGPYPATSNPLFTSVGPHAIERFWRPLTLQDFPPGLLLDRGLTPAEAQ